MTSSTAPSKAPQAATEAADATAPVVKELELRCSAAHAFDVFTTRIGLWWPTATHSVSSSSKAVVEIEPHLGGRILERTPEGRVCLWGQVVAWEPPGRLAFTWHPGRSEDGEEARRETRVEILFEAVDATCCRVRLVHDGWQALGTSAAATRAGYHEGWDGVLALYGDCAAGGGPGG